MLQFTVCIKIKFCIFDFWAFDLFDFGQIGIFCRELRILKCNIFDIEKVAQNN